MKRWTRFTCVMAWMPISAIAQTPLVERDFVEVLMEETSALDGDDVIELSDDYAAKLMLKTDSIYSDLRPVPNTPPSPAWATALIKARPWNPLSPEQGWAAFALRMGLTRARPLIEVRVDRGYSDLDRLIGASATKAAIDRDIFNTVLDMFDYSKASIAANYAVGAQLLREMAARVDPSEHAGQNIRPEVLQRFMKHAHYSQISEEDGEYLLSVLDSEIRAFEPGVSPSTQQPYIPAHFRVARLAAAYYMKSGYMTPRQSPCLPSGDENPGHAGLGMDIDAKEICFSAATDRATHAWFVRHLADQEQGIKRYSTSDDDPAIFKLLRPASIIVEALDIANFTRFALSSRIFAKKTSWARPGVNRLPTKINRMCKK
ncbi:hypothetical protein EC912_10811 [Luteibacter rhizovicinus]|uniref:Transglycosylase SLT domain-containing protein n=1 Tax=Luteibacter rhizovicinus TaxID=242606 RepID=A0A4R3YIK0_9GAMM|nr:hypothetical protein [Luteibacter rhizovicinus]TCV92020.1 hypothetical protein EC912_10811 [Luteibacter rhizovicinus]